MIVAVLAGDHTLQIQTYLFQLISQCFQSINFVMYLLAQLTLTCILNVSKQVLDTYFLSLRGTNSCWRMHKLSINITVVIGLLLCEVCLGG